MLEKQRPRNPSILNSAKTKLVKFKIEPGSKPPNMEQDMLDPLLIRAALDGEEDEARALLAKGADANARDGSGSTPLMLACRYGHTGTVALLLEDNANVNMSDNYGWTALMWAAVNYRIGIMMALVERDAFVGIGIGQEPVRMWDKIINHAKANQLIMQMKMFQDLFGEVAFRPFLSNFRQCASR
jgi:ankyrin repeat protein